MIVYEALKKLETDSQTIGLTIGNFDGMHLGHQSILKHLRERIGLNGHSVVMTFSNHPAQILKPDFSPSFLCSLSQKMRLIKRSGVDSLFILPFTSDLANLSPAAFLSMLRNFIPFTHLILGHDATIGKNRTGTRDHLKQLADSFSFHLEYLNEVKHHHEPISSTIIRSLIKAGDLLKAAALLGRPYSLYSQIETGRGLGKTIGFPTLNLNIDQCCLPPLGVYKVRVMLSPDLSLPGIANVGVAPTVRSDSSPKLEVHLLDPLPQEQLSHLEVVFEKFIRPERKFDSLEDLRLQIKTDIDFLKSDQIDHPDESKGN